MLAILAEQLVLHGDIKTIVTSGHSLGGALATLSAISANQRFPQCRVITYSYGAPRIGVSISFDSAVVLGRRLHTYHLE